MKLDHRRSQGAGVLVPLQSNKFLYRACIQFRLEIPQSKNLAMPINLTVPIPGKSSKMNAKSTYFFLDYLFSFFYWPRQPSQLFALHPTCYYHQIILQSIGFPCYGKNSVYQMFKPCDVQFQHEMCYLVLIMSTQFSRTVMQAQFNIYISIYCVC